MDSSCILYTYTLMQTGNFTRHRRSLRGVRGREGRPDELLHDLHRLLWVIGKTARYNGEHSTCSQQTREVGRRTRA